MYFNPPWPNSSKNPSLIYEVWLDENNPLKLPIPSLFNGEEVNNSSAHTIFVLEPITANHIPIMRRELLLIEMIWDEQMKHMNEKYKTKKNYCAENESQSFISFS